MKNEIPRYGPDVQLLIHPRIDLQMQIIIIKGLLKHGNAKNYILFTKEEGVEDHCHIGALSLGNQRIFDWLHILLRIE
ncbi:MAG: hypothetical protein WBX01_08935 [Nitrososphaeraceae archaeon]